MKRERFQELMEDKSVIKFNGRNHGYFVNNETKLVIYFSFNHKGLPIHIFQEHTPRIILKIISLDNYKKDMPLTEINKDTLIMVNSNQGDEFALTFNLQIDEINQKVKVRIQDFPKLGQDMITKEEKDGLEIDIRLNIFFTK